MFSRRLKIFDFFLVLSIIRVETCGNRGKRAKTENCLPDRKWPGKANFNSPDAGQKDEKFVEGKDFSFF
jgi:hypothetical protein